MSATCRSCGQEMSGSDSGFCPRCLFGTAIAELTHQEEEQAPTWEVMEDYLRDYTFEGELGRGGSGVVYEAREKSSGEKVAVKVLNPSLAQNPEFVERFRREAQVMSELQHPHVVAVRTWGEQSGLLYLVMEFVAGGDVARLLRKQVKLPLAEASRLLAMACEGLSYSHDKGILHRDIKPGNLLVDSHGQVKVADFGLAKILNQQSEVGLTMTNAKMGTPRYMAPEQMEEAGQVDERTDVYSLGVVLYEMLTGKTPGGSFALPSELVAVGEQVDAVVLCAMSDEAEERFSSVAEFGKALSALERRTGRGKLVLAAIALFVVVAALVGIGLKSDSSSVLPIHDWTISSKTGGALPAGYPSRLEGVHQIVLSDSEQEFGIALRGDGSLEGFGANDYGQASPPEGRSFVEVAIGRGPRAAHALALTSEGQVLAWGDNSFGQATVPSKLEDATAIAAGEFWSAARVRGEWFFWGKGGGESALSGLPQRSLQGRSVVAEKK